MATFLTSREAAIKLGITQELLWMYTRYAPKTGENRKLSYSLQKGFSTDTLDEWVQYLQVPWASSDEKRPSIPTYIQDYLKVEAGGQCALCGAGHKLESAHVIPYEESRNHYHHNLIRLCTDCHSKYDDGILARAEIQKQKDKLIAQIRERLSTEKNQHFVHVINAPVIDTIFIGRSQEKQTLFQYLDEDRPIIVQGVGGIGKTQLVLNALHGYQFQRIAWVSLESVSTLAEIETVLNSNIAVGDRSQFEALNSLPSFRGIIVLDGIENHLFSDWDNFIDFLSQIIGIATQAKFIITSQSELHGLRPTPNVLVVEPLPHDEISTFFTQFLRDIKTAQINQDDIEWFVEFVDGHPLTARIITSLIEYFKDSSKVKQRIQGIGIDALKTPVRSKQQRSTALDTCLRAAYECFTHDQKRLLQYLTRFPAGCPVYRAENWQKSIDFDVNLAELQRLHFLYIGPNPVIGYESLYMLNPIRNFVGWDWKNNRYREAADIQLGVANEMAFWATYIVFERLQSPDLSQVEWGLALAESELANFIEAMKYGIWGSNTENGSKDPDKYLSIVIGVGHLSTYFHLRAFPQLAIQFAVESAKAYERLDKYESAAENYNEAASFYTDLYDLSGLEKIVQKVVDLQKKSSSPLLSVYCHINLGRLAFGKKDFLEAITSLEHGLQELEDIKETDEDTLILLLNVFGQLALAHQESQQTNNAIEYYKKAHELRHKLGYVADDGVHYHQMGNCYCDMHDFVKAEEYYVKAAIQFATLYRGEYLTNSLSELGNLVAEHDFSEITKKSLTRELLKQGLNALIDQVQIFVEYYSRMPFSHDARFMLTRKIFTMIELVSFSFFGDLLGTWHEDFQQLFDKFTTKLQTKYPNKPSGRDFNLLPEGQVAWTLVRFHDYAILAHLISQSNREEVARTIDHMFGDSYLDLSIEIEENRLRPYTWFNKWEKSRVDPTN